MNMIGERKPFQQGKTREDAVLFHPIHVLVRLRKRFRPVQDKGLGLIHDRTDNLPSGERTVVVALVSAEHSLHKASRLGHHAQGI